MSKKLLKNKATRLFAAAVVGTLAAVCCSGAGATIISFSFDARGYGVDAVSATTAGNVSVSGTYDDTMTDSSGRFLMTSFNWSGDSQLNINPYSCSDLSTCLSASNFAYYDATTGTPFMELNDPAHFFSFGTALGNLYSDSGGNGTWNVADIVEFTYEGTASGVDANSDPVSGAVSGTGSFDAGKTTMDGKHPLVSFSWNDVDSALGGLGNFSCAELALCADELDDLTFPDVLLFDPVTMLPYFQLHDSALFLSYGVSVGNIYSDSCCNGEWQITSLTKNGQVVPEPTTLALMTLGLAGLGYSRRKTR